MACVGGGGGLGGSGGGRRRLLKITFFSPLGVY